MCGETRRPTEPPASLRHGARPARLRDGAQADGGWRRGSRPAVAPGASDYLTTEDGDGAERRTRRRFQVFYLRYHGYRWYFPLMALARYRNLRLGNTRRVEFGL